MNDERENTLSENKVERTESSRLIWIIMAAVALWGIYHAVGLLLTTSQKEKLLGVHRWWRPAASSSTAPGSSDEREEKLAIQNQNTAAETISERVDVRKPLVLLVSSFSFLAFWGVMLYVRKRRLERQKTKCPL